MLGVLKKKDSHTDKAVKFIASLGYTGYIPFAPGTAGTAVAMALFWLAQDLSQFTRVVIVIFVLCLGVPVAGRAEALYGQKDSSSIVVDEFVGYWITMLWLPTTAYFMLGGFLLFRIFDVAKPLGIRGLEKRYQGGFGIMMDDVLAGFYANILLQALRLFL